MDQIGGARTSAAGGVGGRGPGRRRAMQGLVAALALHAAALGALGSAGSPPGLDAAARPPMAVRLLAPAAPLELPLEPPAEPATLAVAAALRPPARPPDVPPPDVPHRRERPARRVAVSTPAPTAPDAPIDASPAGPRRMAGAEPAAPPAAEHREPLRAVPVVATSADTSRAADAGSAETDPETEPIPHYRTRVPASIGLRYDVRRGGLSGVGQIDWRHDGNRYDLRLEFRYAGLALLEQTSTGGFDADGLAPARFVDKRIRRAAQAANFQREAHRLSWSGSDREVALRPGAQDRLSWMIQLAAIVSADPALARPGGRVTMFVTGARGDVAVWTFRSAGPEPFELRSGRIEAVRFVREGRGEHEITVQAWLDPARGYLPAGASQQAGPSDEPYELRLIEAS